LGIATNTLIAVDYQSVHVTPPVIKLPPRTHRITIVSKTVNCYFSFFSDFE
jgi:hypothetical protein